MPGRASARRRAARPRLLGTIALLAGLAGATLAGTAAFSGAEAAPAPTGTATPSVGAAAALTAAATASPAATAGRFVITDTVVELQPARSRAEVQRDQQRLARAHAKALRDAALKRMHPAGAAQRYAALKVLKRGWAEKEFTCLVALWGHESGWRTHAGSAEGAYGIPQAYPGPKMGASGGDWRDDAHVQIRWGLGYIAGHYGTPCGAWAHWQGARSY